MATPKQRHTKSKRNRRRSHLSLDKTKVVKCVKCGNIVLPHRLCENCGVYAGKEVVNVLAKLDKKERKKKEKEIDAQSPRAENDLSMEGLSKK